MSLCNVKARLHMIISAVNAGCWWSSERTDKLVCSTSALCSSLSPASLALSLSIPLNLSPIEVTPMSSPILSFHSLFPPPSRFLSLPWHRNEFACELRLSFFGEDSPLPPRLLQRLALRHQQAHRHQTSWQEGVWIALLDWNYGRVEAGVCRWWDHRLHFLSCMISTVYCLLSE